MSSTTTTATPTGAAELPNWTLVRRLLALSWEYRAGCFRVLALQVVLLASNLGSLGLTGLGIDFVAHRLDPRRPPPSWPLGMVPPAQWAPMTVVTSLAAAVLVLALVKAWTDYTYQIALVRLVQGRIVVQLRTQVYDKLQRLSFRFFDSHASGSIINRVTSDVQNVRMFVDQVLIQILILLLQLGLSLVYMLRVHVPLTVACLLSTPLLWVGGMWFSRVVRPGYARNRELVDALTGTLTENVQGVRVIKGFARQQDQMRRYAEGNGRVRDQQRWIFWRLCAFISSLGFLSQANLIVLLAYGGTLVVQGKLPLGAGLIVFAGLLGQFSNQVFKVADIANSVQQSLTAARRVFEVLDTPVEITSPPPARAVPLPRARGKVVFESVAFDYRGESHGVLHDVTFRIEPGCFVAILGPTGAGKTALLSLIPRFYDPIAGRVRIDGHDVRDLDLDDLRRNIGLVFQENFLFSNTVAANIAFGQPDATAAQIERAARLASAHDFIQALPQGYQTILGESAVDLSGGQRQRLAIARALLLEPPILLLDDPTAAIDPGTEHEILSALDTATVGRTTFLVAHRISTLQRADLVMVMDKGRVVEIGTPAELLGRVGGQYRRVADLQVADVLSRSLLSAA